MIVLFTDFGIQDPYVGQVKARLLEAAPAQQIVDLLHEAPVYNTHASAHLLAAFAPTFPPGTVFFAVVDPGVGTVRDAIVMLSDGQWFVGPDNGLMSIVAARNRESRSWRVTWQPEVLSATFHGRDVFAVIAAEIARGDFPTAKLTEAAKLNVMFDAEDMASVIYLDHFGNAWTGMRGAEIPAQARITANSANFEHSESFGFVGRGEGFWFVNSVGLLELAVNRGSAALQFGLTVGDPVQVQRPL
ncbi:MAG: SAM hydrolase/SAM-dependent halogenase family protein [Thiobacillus sp.]